MQVTINAETKELPEACSVAQMIELLSLQNKRLAVEINKELVPRSEFASHQIQAGDEIEIVQAIGGG